MHVCMYVWVHVYGYVHVYKCLQDKIGREVSEDVTPASVAAAVRIKNMTFLFWVYRQIDADLLQLS